MLEQLREQGVDAVPVADVEQRLVLARARFEVLGGQRSGGAKLRHRLRQLLAARERFAQRDAVARVAGQRLDRLAQGLDALVEAVLGDQHRPQAVERCVQLGAALERDAKRPFRADQVAGAPQREALVGIRLEGAPPGQPLQHVQQHGSPCARIVIAAQYTGAQKCDFFHTVSGALLARQRIVKVV